MKQEYRFSGGERGRFHLGDGEESRAPFAADKPDWLDPTGPIGRFAAKLAKNTLGAYRASPQLVTEHANLEYDTARGGYAHRQLFELVQNSADALLDAPNGSSILLRLTERALYCADNGNPIDESGVEGLAFAHMSNKRNTAAIGRFGLGFKSVLGVSDAPEFYSRPGSFRFDKKGAADRIAKIVSAERYPVLRLPEPIDPRNGRDGDEDLRELMTWATNIVRLPLKEGARDELAQQMRGFPPEFLLFVDHVRYLSFENGEFSRSYTLRKSEGTLYLDTGENASRWRLFETTHRLSPQASDDRRTLDHDGEVRIQWAAPLDRISDAGKFWAFFPTDTASLVAGILNASWKTNEDRSNLLQGTFNEELIAAAATMIAEALPELATNDDPARHLDALPRRRERGDSELANHLRRRLFSDLHGRQILPDQDGNLRTRHELRYPPSELTLGHRIHKAPFDRWAAYAERPRDWLHHRALTVDRLAIVDRLFDPEGEPPRWPTSGAPRSTIATWLEALTKSGKISDPIGASMASVQIAALIPDEVRIKSKLGKIVLTAADTWCAPNPQHIFLFGGAQNYDDGARVQDSYVHPELMSNGDTVSALETLGLTTPSPETEFGKIVDRISTEINNEELDEESHHEFWRRSRELSVERAQAVVEAAKGRSRNDDLPWEKIRVRALSGDWLSLHSVLIPGAIVSIDRVLDSKSTVDVHFHDQDMQLLCALGATETPKGVPSLPENNSWYREYYSECRRRYLRQDNLPNKPRYVADIGFYSERPGAWPLDVLPTLCDESKSRYTEALLNLDASYEQWTMWYPVGMYKYPTMNCESFTVYMLRKYGRIRVSNGIVPLSDALELNPRSQEALRTLLTHPKADKIKAAFDLADPSPVFYGEEEPTPLTDLWPSLKYELPERWKVIYLVHCERILVLDQPCECIYHASHIYISNTLDDDDPHKLLLVARELNLDLDLQKIEAILSRKTPQEIEERRDAVRQYATDAERLLAAVGEENLRRNIPSSLLSAIEIDGGAVTGLDVAEAAIATWHTDALRQYKWALDRLDPPSRWAGSSRAVEFVRSLGFSADWAGERGRRRDPYLEVEGPRPLPSLHAYQRTATENVRKLLRGEYGAESERRGMIAMPTGSGKTRVAVQAIVEAMRDDGFCGGVLWVADRDELCEQAVEAWRQAWAFIGSEAKRLRISRMWAGQRPPAPTAELHVVVATIQTLATKLSRQPDEYRFLTNFDLVVFDEAHRSIAPTFTSAMEEIGLTRFRRAEEPFLIGLTATPYRGRDEAETERLVRRYGGKRLDSGAFRDDDPQAVIRELQDTGVLSRVDHETIEGEVFSSDTISSDEWERILAELKKAADLPWLPRSVEDRIARSSERTLRIVRAYEEHIQPDWPTLIFATSVEHAQTVAALLNRKGVRSRAVSGETDPAVRRRVVGEFREGKIKALVNYNVFREGFDAPRTRAIIVARPVYSPNLYFQMIGRGLRGPKNGGDERCLILNVQDNIENFDRALAFSELDWLWA